MSLVSVIIPTHFRADRLRNAIESVINQTYRDLEIIIVSDGYDPDTEKLAEEAKKRDSRINYYSYNQSKGGNHARNVGIEHASGDFIAFLDDDDIWYPSKIKLQMELIRSDASIGLVGCGIQVVNTVIHKNYVTIFNDSGEQSKSILYRNIIGSTSCVLIRRTAIKECGKFDEDLPARQDHDLWIRICQKYKIDFVKSVQLDYYVYDSQGKGAQVSKSLDKFIKAHDIIMSKYTDLYKKLTPEEYTWLIAIRYCSIAVKAHEVGDSSAARKYAVKSFRKKPNCKALFYLLFSWVPYHWFVQIRALFK